MFYRFFLVLFTVIFIASCTDTAIVDKHIAIPERAWSYDEKLQLDVQITDQNQPYNIYLNFRHTPKYRYANVFVLLCQESPSGLIDTVRVEIPLAEPDGRWLGRSAGTLYAYQYLVASHYLFPDTGMYRFYFEQNMRENPLEGVSDVGIRIVPDAP